MLVFQWARSGSLCSNVLSSHNGSTLVHSRSVVALIQGECALNPEGFQRCLESGLLEKVVGVVLAQIFRVHGHDHVRVPFLFLFLCSSSVLPCLCPFPYPFCLSLFLWAETLGVFLQLLEQLLERNLGRP